MERVEELSVAIGPEELAWARQRAEREGTSLSAIVTAVLRSARLEEAERARREAAWQEYLDWATAGRGVDSDELKAALREIDGQTDANRPAAESLG